MDEKAKIAIVGNGPLHHATAMANLHTTKAQDIILVDNPAVPPFKISALPELAEIMDVRIPKKGTHPPFIKKTPDIGRNQPCPCGSGKKYKKCCLPK